MQCFHYYRGFCPKVFEECAIDLNLSAYVHNVLPISECLASKNVLRMQGGHKPSPMLLFLSHLNII